MESRTKQFNIEITTNHPMALGIVCNFANDIFNRFAKRQKRYFTRVKVTDYINVLERMETD